MNKEIERKFLVTRTDFLTQAFEKWRIRQGFILTQFGRCLRIREDDTGNGTKYTLCLKISKTKMTRNEYEYEIPAEDGLQLLDECPNLIEKTRYRVAAEGSTGNELFWDIDVFERRNEGLIVAEIELPSEEFLFIKPDWLGEEVTHDPKYLNTNLYMTPYDSWKKEP